MKASTTTSLIVLRKILQPVALKTVDTVDIVIISGEGYEKGRACRRERKGRGVKVCMLPRQYWKLVRII